VTKDWAIALQLAKSFLSIEREDSTDMTVRSARDVQFDLSECELVRFPFGRSKRVKDSGSALEVNGCAPRAVAIQIGKG